MLPNTHLLLAFPAPSVHPGIPPEWEKDGGKQGWGGLEEEMAAGDGFGCSGTLGEQWH